VARIPARRQRGDNFLRPENKVYNPRLPVNRGFFVFWPTISTGRNFLKGFMRQQFTKIITRSEPQTEFEVGSLAPVPDRGALEAELEQLKERLLDPLLKAAADPNRGAPLRLAANEAASLAWFTPFPLLFFPALLEEKVRAVQRQEARQRQIRQRTEGLLEQAVT
jgi:hypothetical protein